MQDNQNNSEQVGKKKTGRVVLIVFLVLLVVCICSSLVTSLAIGGAIKGIFSLAHEQSEVLMVPVEGYLDAMEDGNLDLAQTYFTPQVGLGQSLAEELQEELADNAHLYQNTSKVTLQNFSVSLSPQGGDADISGMIEYPGAGYRAFEASLEKDSGVWKLTDVSIEERLYESRFGDVPAWAEQIFEQLYQVFEEFLSK